MNVAGAYPRMNALDALPAKPSNQKGRMMQDVERVKAAILEAIANAPFLDFYEYDKDDNQVPITFRTFVEDTWVGDRTNRILEEAAQLAATAAISAMTPDIWNAAIEAGAEVSERHRRDAWTIAALNGQNDLVASGRNHAGREISEAIRQLKKDTGNLAGTDR